MSCVRSTIKLPALLGSNDLGCDLDIGHSDDVVGAARPPAEMRVCARKFNGHVQGRRGKDDDDIDKMQCNGISQDALEQILLAACNQVSGRKITQ